MNIHGHCDEKFAAVREQFERNFTERGDVGASFAATIEGEYVIDIWGGHRDGAKTLPWEEDTIVNVFSTTKTMTALCALILADRGELRFDDPVAKYWPEYAQNGKESTEIRHFMAHRAGLPGFGEMLTLEQLYDWDSVISVLERQQPWWQPGAEAGYHAITQGFLVGEIVRRITGKSLGTFFRETVAEPLGADFHIGLDPAHFHRTAEMLAGTAPPQMPDLSKIPEFLLKGEPGMPDCMPPETNSAGWRQAEIPAGNGHGNARSVVRAQTAVANGGSAFGTNIISAAGIEQIFQKQGVLSDLQMQHGIGYGLGGAFFGLPAERKICFWGGAGGSTIAVDTEQRMCFSYVMNQMDMNLLGDPRGKELSAALYQSLLS